MQLNSQHVIYQPSNQSSNQSNFQLIDNRFTDHSRSRTMQFDESSDRYRCCCECFHVKTAAMVVGSLELIVIFVLLINSLILLAHVDSNREYPDIESIDYGSSTIWGSDSPIVLTPLIACFVSLAVAFLAVCCLFLGIARRSPYWLAPHIAVQCVGIVLLAATLICGILALFTNLTIFYRLLNAVKFNQPPNGENKVALGTYEKTHVYIILAIYAVLLFVEIWFVWLLIRCYRYFKDRRTYMNYCLEYSTPMRTVHVRVPQYGTR